MDGCDKQASCKTSYLCVRVFSAAHAFWKTLKDPLAETLTF